LSHRPQSQWFAGDKLHYLAFQTVHAQALFIAARLSSRFVSGVDELSLSA